MDARVDQLGAPTLAAGESLADLPGGGLRPRGGGRARHGLRAARPAGPRAPVRRPGLTWGWSPGSTPRRSPARSSSSTPTTGEPSCAAGRATHPDGTEVRSRRVVAGAAGGGRRTPVASTTCGRLAWAGSSTGWSASTRPARWCARRCSGTTPARRRRPPTWSPSSAAAAPGRRRSARCRSPRSPSPSSGGCAEHEPGAAPPYRRGLPAARLAHVAAPGHRPGSTTWSPTGATPAAPATGPPPPARYRPDLLERALGHAPVVPQVLAGRRVRGSGRWPGCVLAAGTGDNAGAALGLGAGPGDVVLSIGTSGVVSRGLRACRPRTRRAPWPGSPTPPDASCRWWPRSTRPGCWTPPPGSSASTTTGSPSSP